jgi:phage terminase large subunit
MYEIEVVKPAGVVHAMMPRPFTFLFKPKRYKVAYGGRGSAKSWTFARALVLLMDENPGLRVLCAREFQNSIAESVHQLLVDQIFDLGLAHRFAITDKTIRHVEGGHFIFAGIRSNITKIKSMEGIDIVWVEEAEVISERSWEILIPTIRKGKVYTAEDGRPGPEIWVTFNPSEEDDPSYKRFVKNTPEDCIALEVNWTDNPYFPPTLRTEKDYLYRIDVEAANHVWGGKCRTNGAAQIFRNRYVVESFEIPEKVRWFHGLDFGFSGDPSAFIRCYTTGKPGVDEDLWIPNESFGYGVEIDELPKMMKGSMDTAERWPIKADNSRPETISYIKRQGFMITGADKWGGSVEDGIAHLKGFRKIHVHTRCKHIAQEFRLYSYKIDRVTQEVLPIVVDKHNHGIDALRYALDGYIKRRGADKVWSRFAGHEED